MKRRVAAKHADSIVAYVRAGNEDAPQRVLEALDVIYDIAMKRGEHRGVRTAVDVIVGGEEWESVRRETASELCDLIRLEKERFEQERSQGGGLIP